MKTKKLIAGMVAVVAAAIMMVALCACGAKEITVNINDNGTTSEKTVQAGKTVGDILSAADITVNDGDVVDPALDTKIEENGKTITITRNAKVSIVVDGKTLEVELAGATVKDALEKAEVSLAEGDKVDVDLTTCLTDGMTITVTRAVVEKPKANNSSSSSKSSSKSSGSSSKSGKTVVSKTKVPNCNGDGHGYYEIHYSDGSTSYQEY